MSAGGGYLREFVFGVPFGWLLLAYYYPHSANQQPSYKYDAETP